VVVTLTDAGRAVLVDRVEAAAGALSRLTPTTPSRGVS